MEKLLHPHRCLVCWALPAREVFRDGERANLDGARTKYLPMSNLRAIAFSLSLAYNLEGGLVLFVGYGDARAAAHSGQQYGIYKLHIDKLGQCDKMAS
jgi:hypothetical protein